MKTTLQTPRAAIYARYSSDLQSAASIPDQVRNCRRHCLDQGWTITEVFADEAMSGSSHLRPGFQELQQAAMRGDIIVAESLDRLSRDQEHAPALFKRMTYLGIRIVTLSEGEINELHIGLSGTMSAIFLRQLAEKTHRGLEGRIRAGKSARGLSYGYRVKRELLADGSWTSGEREIDPDEAAIITRIFRDYASGQSTRTIAIELNREGIPAPRAANGRGTGEWSHSTIAGNWKRGTGILNNEIYIGRLVWNRQTFVKDPATGKRQARPNPQSEWIIEETPDLRIIDDTMWQAVKARQGAIREEIFDARTEDSAAPRTEQARRPSYLLSGLLKCNCCGSGYSMIGAGRYGCSAARNKGTCDNRRTITREALEARVLGGLRDHLLEPELLDVFIEEYRRAFNEAAAGADAERDKAKRDLAQVEKKIAGIITAIEDGMYQPSMKERIAELEAEKHRLTAMIADHPEPPVMRLHPSLTNLYRQKIADLAAVLQDPELKAEATSALRSLISKIRLIPDKDAPGGHHLELIGESAGILSLAASANAQTTKPPRGAGAGGSRLGSETVVAGTGFTNCFRMFQATIMPSPAKAA